MSNNEKNEKIYLTREAYNEVLEEIKVLKERITTGFAGKIRVNNEGTLDDFDFEDAERENRKLVGMLNDKYNMLNNIIIVTNDKTEEIVNVGDVVFAEVAFAENDKENLLFKLVATAIPDVNATTPEYTVNSPLGKSIFGKKINEESSYKLNGNTVKVRVLDINNSLVNDKKEITK